MGRIRFQIPHPGRVNDEAVERAYMAGVDGIPWACNTIWDEDCLVLSREVDESGNFYIPWTVTGYGELMLSTGSLMERARPYRLPVELARGTINRIRNQLAAWQSAEFVVNDEIRRAISHAVSILSNVVTRSSDSALEQAEEATRAALQAIDLLVHEYTHQRVSARHQQAEKLQTVFGVNLGRSPPEKNRSNDISAAFNSAVVPMTWSEVEATTGNFDWCTSDQQVDWCCRQSMKILGGPLISLDAGGLPDWLILWEDDFETLQSYALNFIDVVVKRFQGKVALWNCAARMNAATDLRMSEEQQLSLTVRVIDRVREIEPRTPIIVTFDQPWAEYIARSAQSLSPLYFADALARAGLGISGFGLEINLGYWPEGSSPRDLLEISRQLDRWGMFGLPLVVFLTTPSSDAEDPCAHRNINGRICLSDYSVTANTQKSFVQRLILLVLTKPWVQGIVWNQLDDAQPHDFPHGGLFAMTGEAKPLMGELTSIRREHLV